ncbi:cyclophilin-like fold protein [Sphingomonas sp. IC-56]
MAFYAPWGNLAIFYGDGHHSPGLIRLGRLEDGLAGLAGGAQLSVNILRL